MMMLNGIEEAAVEAAFLVWSSRDAALTGTAAKGTR